MFKIVYPILVYSQFKTLDQVKEPSKGKFYLYYNKQNKPLYGGWEVANMKPRILRQKVRVLTRHPFYSKINIR